MWFIGMLFGISLGAGIGDGAGFVVGGVLGAFGGAALRSRMRAQSEPGEEALKPGTAAPEQYPLPVETQLQLLRDAVQRIHDRQIGRAHV